MSCLDEKGRPTPLVHLMLRAPESRMDVLRPEEIDRIVGSSFLVKKYAETVDDDSAHEMLERKLEKAASEPVREARREDWTKHRRTSRREKTTFEKVFESTTTRQIGRTIARELTRGLLGVLGVK